MQKVLTNRNFNAIIKIIKETEDKTNKKSEKEMEDSRSKKK